MQQFNIEEIKQNNKNRLMNIAKNEKNRVGCVCQSDLDVWATANLALPLLPFIR